MMKLTMLGTGSAMATACYNTCFALQEHDRIFLVDGGGGNQIFHQLQKANLDWRNIRDMFVTHKHMDHLLGALWMIRLFCQNRDAGKISHRLRVYGHSQVTELLRQLAELMFVPEQARLIGEAVELIPVSDGECRQILGRDVTFFDIRSDKALQFGFTMALSCGKRLTCCGDEPGSELCAPYIRGSQWLMHEAFCLYAHRDVFQPYQKHHSTVKDACRFAEKMQVENLLLYHTEDKHLANRKALYRQEGSVWYSGNIYIPDDLEILELEQKST